MQAILRVRQAGSPADLIGLKLALLVPACCYVWIGFYGLFTARTPARRDIEVASEALIPVELTP